MSVLRYIGIDVAKRELEVFVWPEGRQITLPNSRDGISEVVALARAMPAEMVAYEHTGMLTRTLSEGLRDAGIPTVVLDAKKVRLFATVIGREGKTDRLDARLIAQFAATLRPGTSTLPTPREQELRDLVHRVRGLSVAAAAEKIKRRLPYPASVVSSIESHLVWLKAEIAVLEGAIRQQIAEYPEWQTKAEIIQSMPGCGPVLSRTMLVDLPELGLVGPKPIVSLVGLAPLPKETGETRKKRHVRGGRRWVRRALFMGSVSASRSNERIRQYHGRLLDAGHSRMSARVACMRKMLIILNAMVRDGKAWSPVA